jgi:hypothetical protein
MPFSQDVSAYAGQQVLLIIGAEAADSIWNYLYLDDVAVETTRLPGTGGATTQRLSGILGSTRRSE